MKNTEYYYKCEWYVVAQPCLSLTPHSVAYMTSKYSFRQYESVLAGDAMQLKLYNWSTCVFKGCLSLGRLQMQVGSQVFCVKEHAKHTWERNYVVGNVSPCSIFSVGVFLWVVFKLCDPVFAVEKVCFLFMGYKELYIYILRRFIQPWCIVRGRSKILEIPHFDSADKSKG